MIAMLIIVGGLILIGAIMMLSESFIQIEAKKSGMDDGQRQSLLPSFKNLWQGKGPLYTNGSQVTQLSKGHDILLNGAASPIIRESNVKRYSVKPTDFAGLSPIPRMLVAEGDEVKAGDVLFHDKKNDKVQFTSPVSGEVVEIRRGDKRAIIDVVILADKEVKFNQFDPPSISESSREDIVDFLCQSGGWTLLNERPYDILPSIDVVPQNIFISTFDSAPLAPDLNLQVTGHEASFQKGIDTLARLTSGSVHLGLDARGEEAPSVAFTEANNCQKHWFKGKHPSGNVGIQIHHIAPIKSGDKVWTISVQDVIALGELMHKGIYNTSRLVAVTGAQINDPSYYKTYKGASIDEILEGQLKEGKNRIIDGDPLSGKKSEMGTFVRGGSDQISVIEEGDNYEMFGWLLPITPRPTISKTFPNFLFPNLKFDGETNTHGERRAFVMTGQYESVLPMDIYPQHLMKAILANDYERMEGLGIAELSEEDVALCEFVCTSKAPLQKILREGLEMMREQE